MDGDPNVTAKGTKALEEWARAGETGALKLRDPSKLPEWASGLWRMLDHITRSTPPQEGSLAQRLVSTVIEYGRSELQRRLEQRDISPFAVRILRRFENQLENRLTQTMRPCLDLELKVFEAAFRCVFHAQGEISRNQIEREFIGENTKDKLIWLLQRYPVLAKLWSQLIENWAEKIKELACRLNADRPAIQQTFFHGRNPEDLIDITMDISDPHHGGRETMILRFRKGHVVYKPRSGQSERDWFSLVGWINRQGFIPHLRILGLLRRRDYCWMEFVEHLPCRSKSDAQHYFRRAGGLLCVAYLLDAIDCHRDNLIAEGVQPVLIDTETFLHPKAGFSPHEKSDSMSRTGLLPIPRSLSGSCTDISAFGGAPGKHTPTLKGKHLAASSYSVDVLRGFRDMWKLIGEPRTKTRAAFRRRLRRLSDKPWRRIHRSTRSYFEIRDRSLHPNALRSGLERSRSMALDLLRRGLSAHVIIEEISALRSFDIPHFVAPPGESPSGADSLMLSDLIRRIRSALQRRN
jgi:lantibiotic modifying enzyme